MNAVVKTYMDLIEWAQAVDVAYRGEFDRTIINECIVLTQKREYGLPIVLACWDSVIDSGMVVTMERD